VCPIVLRQSAIVHRLSSPVYRLHNVLFYHTTVRKTSGKADLLATFVAFRHKEAQTCPFREGMLYCRHIPEIGCAGAGIGVF